MAIFVVAVAATAVDAQKKSNANAVMWEPVKIEERDLYLGPGGKEWQPDLSKIEFIKEEKEGHSKKFRIKDGKGREWVAKIGREAQPETAAVRLLWGMGYKTEINYLVPKITIPTQGTYENVRLEARPDHIDRLDEWKWEENPFLGKPELKGLRMMMVFMTNWDVLDLQNKVLEVKTGKGVEHHYIVSDLGATFGRLGNNNLPIIYRLGRKTGSPEHFVKTSFVDGVEEGELDLAYKGKNRDLFKGFTIADGRWLYGLLSRLSDKQITDAFRAANFNAKEVETYRIAVRNKIAELEGAINAGSRAGK